MNKEEIKIITLGDIFRNLETEEQAFEFLKYIKNLQQENKQLKEKVKYQKNKIDNKDKWCQLIADIAFDYDGCNTIESLKLLIDELVRYALNSRDNYDYEEILKGDSLEEENRKYKEVIDKAREYINKYESIKAYYEYIDEDAYDEYNYDEDFKKELLDILKGGGINETTRI